MSTGPREIGTLIAVLLKAVRLRRLSRCDVTRPDETRLIHEHYSGIYQTSGISANKILTVL